jgi:hypothetical protein
MKNIKCYFCGDKESIYVCNEHARQMLTGDEVRRFCIYSGKTRYRTENDEPIYDMDDIREDMSCSIFNHPQLKQESKDTFFRFKNMAEVYYRKKMIREQRKIAIEEFVYTAIKKLDMSYFPAYKQTIMDMIEKLTDEKLITPAECALKVYKAFEDYIRVNNAKKFRAELAIDFLNTQPESVKKIFLNGRTHQKLIDGYVQFEDFTKEVINYVESTKRREILEENIEKYIPENYRYLCRTTMMADNYIRSGDINGIDGLIKFFEIMIQRCESKKIKGLKRADKFFDSF